ncbi:hypothetical protein OH77DRAFT_1021012 [Trametes cingulata]|nr:hypothetical protein OH77DRAFT_1021012 [Trametes cingulata]
MRQALSPPLAMDGDPTAQPQSRGITRLQWQPTGQQSTPTRSASPPPLPPFPKEWAFPSIEELMKQREELFTWEEKEEAFALLAGTVKKHTDEMIDRWNTEIDTYLVYAGLFSAIVTAFNVQSYLVLQQQPDPMLAAMQQISLQLSSLAIHPPFINSTQPAFGSSDAARAGPAPGPPPGAATVAINTLWFSSLVLSLSSASVGIMVKQWLNEFKSGLPSDKTASEKGESRKGRETLESARLRQYRLNNLEKWRVHLIVLAIPVLLQLALAFFLAGLLVLVWSLHPTVAAVTTSFVSLLAIFTLASMLLPAFKQSCAYLSPQALLVDSASRWIRYIVLRLISTASLSIYRTIDPSNHTGVVCTFLRRVKAVADKVRDWTYSSAWMPTSSPRHTTQASQTPPSWRRLQSGSPMPRGGPSCGPSTDSVQSLPSTSVHGGTSK